MPFTRGQWDGRALRPITVAEVPLLRSNKRLVFDPPLKVTVKYNKAGLFLEAKYVALGLDVFGEDLETLKKNLHILIRIIWDNCATDDDEKLSKKDLQLKERWLLRCSEVDGSPPDPSIEIRRREEGNLDEIVGFGVNVHLEQMDDNTWWMSIRIPETDQEWHVNFSARGKIKATVEKQ